MISKKLLKYVILFIFLGIFPTLLIRGVILEKGLLIYRDLVVPLDTSQLFTSFNFIWKYYEFPDWDQQKRIFLEWIILITSPEIHQKIMFLLTIILPIVCSFGVILNILKIFDNKKIGDMIITSALLSIINITNPIFINLLIQEYTALAYAVLPLFVLFIYKSFTASHINLKNIIISSIIYIIMTCFVIHYLIIGGIIIGIMLSITLIRVRTTTQIFRIFLTFFLVISITLLLGSFIFLPYILLVFNGGSLNPPYVISQDIIQAFSFQSNVLRVLLLNSNAIWIPWINIETDGFNIIFLLLLPIISFSSIFMFPMNSKKSNMVIYYSILALSFAYLGKGTNEPFGEIYVYLATELPLINWIFRVPTKFIYALPTTYLLLLATIVGELLMREKRKLAFGLIIMITISQIILLVPGLANNFDNIITTSIPPDSIYEANAFLRIKSGDFKVFWYPSTDGESVSWNAKSTPDIYPFSSSRPTFLPWSPIMRLLITLSQNMNSTDLCRLFGAHGIKYVVYHDDVSPSIKMRKDTLIMINLLNNSRMVFQSGIIKVYDVGNYSNNIYVSQKRIILVGGLDILSKLISYNKLDSIVLVNQELGDKMKTALLSADMIISNKTMNDTIYDLLPYFIDTRYIIKPFEFVKRHEPSSVWSIAKTIDPLHGPWHYYLEGLNITNWELDYNAGLVFTWSDDNINIPFKADSNGNYLLLIRIFESKAAGDIKISIDNHYNFSIVTKSDSNSFNWRLIPLSNVTKDNHILSINNVLGFNSINLICIIPEYIHLEATQKVFDLLSSKSICYLNGSSMFINSINAFLIKDNKVNLLNYRRINPTLYEVQVQSPYPFNLGFTEAYDPLWIAIIEGKEYASLPNNFGINTFWINQTGNLNIKIRYKPQDWYETGLIISELSITICLFYIIYNWKRKHQDNSVSRLSLRTFLNRIVTYPILLLIMPLYYIVDNKTIILDAFYIIRGWPHGWIQKDNRIAYYDGMKIIMPFREDPSFDDVWLRNVYYLTCPSKIDIIVDVGAHMGFFTIKVAKYVHTVIAIEPNPRSYMYLLYNLKINHIENVKTLNVACGERDDYVKLKMEYSLGGTKVFNETNLNIRVKLKRLDDIMDKMNIEPSFIKIDTEGYEYEVLKGSEQLIKKNRPRLLISTYHYNGEVTIISNYLRQYDYYIIIYYVRAFLRRAKEFYVYAIPMNKSKKD